MTRRIILLATVSFALIGPAWALQEPEPCPGGDARMRCVAASPNQVVLLRARAGASLVIEMPHGERVVAVPVSDNALMTRGQGSPNARVASEEEAGATVDGNLAVAVRGTAVVVKPYVPLSPQPLFILTEREGRQQRYAFELRADAGSDAPYYFSVRMRNVAAEEAERRARTETEQRERTQRVARERLAQVSAAPCTAKPEATTEPNFRYVGQGDRSLAPVSVCDSGLSIFLRFASSQRMPAIFSVTPDGAEAAINSSADLGGWVVVHGYVERLRLRDGERVLDIINRGFDQYRHIFESATIVRNVTRRPRATPEEGERQLRTYLQRSRQSVAGGMAR